mgnify:CR=1 FL=1|jgi:hypothetical protein
MIYDIEIGMCRVCPMDTPLFMGDKCVKCDNNTIWSVK